MSTMIVGTKINHRYLMGKSKQDLASWLLHWWDDVLEILQVELKWCKEHPEEAHESVEWRKGFMKGLEHGRNVVIALRDGKYPTGKTICQDNHETA